MTTPKKPIPIEETMAAREDDIRELKKRKPTLAEQIGVYLDDRLSADEMDALSRRYGVEIERERVRRDTQSKSKKFQEREDARIFWAGGGTRDEAYQAQVALQQFVQSHREFEAETPENGRNGQKLREWLTTQQLACTVANLEKAYADLKSRGEIITVTAEERAIREMSADQFKASRPELADNRTPPIARESVEKALNTFRSFHPEYIASERNRVVLMQWLEETALPPTAGNLQAAFNALKGQGLLELSDAIVSFGQTRVIDYGPREPGYPAQPSKYSFREKLKSMTSEEVRQRCLDDPAFERALDSLEK